MMEPLFVKRSSCPLCQAGVPGAGERFLIRQLDQVVRVIECPVCGLVYKETRLTSRGLKRIYNEHYAHHTGGSGGDDWGAAEYVRRMRLKTGCRHLDYGCGNGHVVLQARRAGIDSYGADPFLSDDRLHGCGGPFFFRGAADSGQLQGMGMFDAISLWAVLEHLENPLEVFNGLSRMLNSGGLLFFNAPNADCLTARIDGGHWSIALLMEHSTFWTRKAVAHLAAASGLSVRAVRRCGLPYPLNRRAADWASFGLSPDGANTGEEPRAAPQEAAAGPALSARCRRQVVAAGRRLVKNRCAGAFVRLALNLTGLGDHYDVVLEKR